MPRLFNEGARELLARHHVLRTVLGARATSALPATGHHAPPAYLR